MDVAGGSLAHTEEPTAAARDQCILVTSAAAAAHWPPWPSCVPDTRRSLRCRERCCSTVPTDLSSLARCTCDSNDDFDTSPLEPAASLPAVQPSALPWTDALICDSAPASPLLDAADRLSGHPATPQHSLPAVNPMPERSDLVPAALLAVSLVPGSPLPRLLRLGAALAALPTAAAGGKRKKAYYAYFSPEHGCGVYSCCGTNAPNGALAHLATSIAAAQRMKRRARPLRTPPAMPAYAQSSTSTRRPCTSRGSRAPPPLPAPLLPP